MFASKDRSYIEETVRKRKKTKKKKKKKEWAK